MEHKDLGHEYELFKIFATWEESGGGSLLSYRHVDLADEETERERERRPLAHSLFGHASLSLPLSVI